MSLDQISRADRILVVDDSPDNLFLIQATLEDDGYQISLAEDGKTALALVEKLLPDLILLDVMMPEMDGYEVTERIRQNPKLPYIPILLITAHERSSVVKGLDIGADDFIRKPVDIDELLARVRSLLRLKHSIDEREQMVRQREDFVSRLTHDLRTPLVAADRMLLLFQQEAFGALPQEMHEAVDSMARSNHKLLQMVNTLLEVYRHEAGCKTLIFNPVEVQELAQEVMQELKPLAEERGLKLTVAVEQSLEAGTEGHLTTVVMGDRLELHRVLTNLVGNAIKFTEQGAITIHVAGAPVGGTPNQPDQKSYVTIAVQDTGVGIPADEQATLFERFHSGEHKRSGSGLGLYLSRRIVESHQGTINVRSQPGKGSVFTIRLPAEK
ncbi:ATP-binding response regulator [Leptodesmis sichuanensis]|uniref:ATP-binding response regulator n=1 Tax=Leptodesmis sichuanensis TaxID=2906798 RepID=UPI001F413063|nr:hybrid sensor histidine kinase/response regulator [Leptodesmis sichuanensis]UIE40151.1 hybrid sensor histidine kinase/response regulator [Leptodesmis sichuanensis A121]